MLSKKYGRSKVSTIQDCKLRNLLLRGAACKGNMDVLLVQATDVQYYLREGTTLRYYDLL